MPTTIDDLKTVQDAEIQRLLALTPSPEDLTLIDTYYRAKWTAATRKTHKATGGYFAGPHDSFPLKDCSDVGDAWGLAGHADDPDQVRSNIKSWAGKHGCTSSLPDTAKEDSDRVETPVVLRADGNHDPFTGTHSHAHPANGSQGGDATHSHEHSHSSDSSHDHSHAEESRAAMPTEVRLYFPIVDISRGDSDKWEVEGVATSEEIDSFGTVFSYEGSKHAFQKWAERVANVREMHDRKAVGKGIGVRFNDEVKKIHLRTRVSKGAPDTWTKVQEGVLDGYSVGAINPVWGTVERNGKKYPYLLSYDLAEVSLVDNASNPDGQGLTLCRANGLTEVVDVSEQETDSSAHVPAAVEVERKGARIGAVTAGKMHESIGHTLQAAASQMRNCNCPVCQAALKQLDPDDDGDIDAFGGVYGDTDNDADSLYGDDDDDSEERMTRLLSTIMEPVNTRITHALAAIAQRSNAVLARMAGQPEYPNITPELIRSAVSAELQTTLETTRGDISGLAHLVNNLITQVGAVERASSQTEVRAELSAVKELVERIAAQPIPGGPVLNGGGRPVDKRLANQSSAPQQGEQAAIERVLSHLQAQGALNSVQAQTAAAALLVQPMTPRR